MEMKALCRWITCVGLVVSAGATHAQNAISNVELWESFGFDFDTAQIRTETVAPGVHVLFGVGGNVIASIGDDGVLIVDDQFSKLVPGIRSAIRGLGGNAIDFVINTHWHGDHADGNVILGTDGSWIVAHANSREMMLSAQNVNFVTALVAQPQTPKDGLPVITYDQTLNFHFNGERIDLKHFGPAHTTGDTVVLFRGNNVVHMGDLFSVGGYPFIDVGNGGDIDGMIQACESVLSEISENAIIVPGHGPVSTSADLQNYVSMLKTIRKRVARLIAEGADLDDVLAAKPTAEWDTTRGDPVRLLDRVFASLKR